MHVDIFNLFLMAACFSFRIAFLFAYHQSQCQVSQSPLLLGHVLLLKLKMLVSVHRLDIDPSGNKNNHSNGVKCEVLNHYVPVFTCPIKKILSRPAKHERTLHQRHNTAPIYFALYFKGGLVSERNLIRGRRDWTISPRDEKQKRANNKRTHSRGTLDETKDKLSEPLIVGHMWEMRQCGPRGSGKQDEREPEMLGITQVLPISTLSTGFLKTKVRD